MQRSLRVLDNFYIDYEVIRERPLRVWVMYAFTLEAVFFPFFQRSPRFLQSLESGASSVLLISHCFTFLLCKFWGLFGPTPFSFPVMRRWNCLGMKTFSQPNSTTPGKTGWETCRSESRREASNAKSRKSLFHFKPVQVNKFEYCDNLWKKNIFHNPVRKLKACL